MIPLCRGSLAIRVIGLAALVVLFFLTLYWLQDPLNEATAGQLIAPKPDAATHTGELPDEAPTKPAPDTAEPEHDDAATEPSQAAQNASEAISPPSWAGSGDETGEEKDTSEDEADQEQADQSPNEPSEWHPLPAGCPSYSHHARVAHDPKSTGRLALGYQRPEPSCRTFNSSLAESTVTRMKDIITDADLYRVFENTYPNTIDTAIKWKGVAANNTDEELCFIITGDIDAMWLRDSANQLQVYRHVITSPKDDVAGVFRGAINLQARYIVLEPYCNAFQAPPESGIPAGRGSQGSAVWPSIDTSIVSTCNFELDSFGAFLQLSEDYYAATQDIDFFDKFQWVYAVQSMLATARDMSAPTYDDEGKRLTPPYTFNSHTNTMTGTLNNVGTGNPVARTGMVRSPFRPSDDTSVFEFLVPANMMFSRYLNSTSFIMDKLTNAPAGLPDEMRDMAAQIHEGIQKHAIVDGPLGDKMYAYEVDGFGGQNLMDDANIPSLLSAPFLGYLDANDEIYKNTRKFVLSEHNPWFARGPVINAVGSPHIKPGHAWPMSSIIRIMTSDDDKEIEETLTELVTSTAGLGLMHESVNSLLQTDWTREWFSWANGLFGQMILDLEERKPHLLKTSFQTPPVGE